MDRRIESRWTGIALVLLAVTCFATQDTLTKVLTATYLPALIVALRYVFSVLWLGLIFGPRHGFGLWRTNRTGLVVFRGVCQGFSSLTMGLALQSLPVAEALSIALTAPLVVVFLSGQLLDEEVGLVRGLAAISGFIGALLILRPGTGLEPLGVAYAAASAMTFVIYLLTSRVLARTETTEALSFHTAVWGTLVVGATWALSGPIVLPDGHLWLMAAGLGFMSSLGHFGLTAAYRFAPASLLAPITYVQLVIVAFLGWQVFGHVPDPLTGLGMGIVIVAGMATGLFQGRRPA